jgi:hypothetical protein
MTLPVNVLRCDHVAMALDPQDLQVQDLTASGHFPKLTPAPSAAGSG